LSASPTGTRGEDGQAFVDVVAGGTLVSRLGQVQAFDTERGRGLVVTVNGAVFGFHATAITDGTRQIDIGSRVAFTAAAAPGGRYEAVALTPVGGLLADRQAVPAHSPRGAVTPA
jgi:cold shock CspA family protein